jgi:hypothetical protein
VIFQNRRNKKFLTPISVKKVVIKYVVLGSINVRKGQ